MGRCLRRQWGRHARGKGGCGAVSEGSEPEQYTPHLFCWFCSLRRLGVGADFQAPHHKVHQGVPVGKEHIAGQGAQVIEEGLAGGQGGADEPVVFVGKGQEGVIEEGQDVHRRQQRGEMLLAVAEVVFEVIALGLERVVVLVFDLPPGAARGDDRGHVLLGDFEVGHPTVAVNDFAVVVGHGHFAPVDLQGVLAFGQRNRVGVAIGIGVEVGPDFDARVYGAQLGPLQQVDPVVERGMGVGLADEDEVKAVQQGAPAKGLMGVNVIAQQDGPQRRVLGGVLFQPAFGGGDLAILLGVAVLRGDELRAQRDGLLVAGGDDDRRHRAVIIGFVAAFMFQAGTVGAVDFLRRVIPSAIQGDEQLVLEGAPALQRAGVAQALQDRIIAGKELFWRDRIERLADVIVRRDLLEVEQALGIALALGLLHGFLVRQEGGALGEEDGKGAQANVFHGIGDIVAGAAVGKTAHQPAQMRQVLLPGFEDWGAHAVSLRRASALSALR